MEERKELKKDIFLCSCLVIAFFALIYIIIPEGEVFGSTTDWLSQHVNLAETLRNEMLDKKTLFLDFIWLGGGNNAYNFSYYGYLRPDVLIGCLLPQVSMETIIIVTMVISFLVTVLLCYYWLRKCDMKPGPAFLGALFCMTANCFFHFHRQIMFINYMPFLFLALILTKRTMEKKSMFWYCIVLTCICFQSYYYAIACFIVIGIYWLQNIKNWKELFLIIKIMALSVGMSCVLLLPTFLALLENKRASGKTDLLSLILPKIRLNGLLYSSYGIGFSMIIMYLLLLGLLHKQYRKASIGYICLFCFPVIPYILNGTLYARAKILMPFLPLILLHTTRILQEDWKGKMKPSSRLAFVVLAIVSIGLVMGGNGETQATLSFVLIDIAIILIFSWIWKKKNKAIVYVLLLIAPIYGTITLSTEEDFVSETANPTIFTQEELAETTTDEWARTDYLTSPLTHVNQIHYSNQKTTGMYSSVSNKRYSEFYHDIMKTPIRINNRVALLPEINPFLQYMMGVKYVVTDEKKIPNGYETIYTKDQYVIAENDNVLPMAYLDTQIMAREAFDELEFPYTVESMINYTVVEDATNVEASETIDALQNQLLDNTNTKKRSRIRRREVQYEVINCPKSLSWEETDNGIAVKATKESECRLRLKGSLKGKIGIICFDVVNKSKEPVTITINGSRNKLSGSGAPYPNENNRFTFFLDENTSSFMKIVCSKGKFQICNVKYYVFPKSSLKKKSMQTVTMEQTTGREVLHCKSQSDGMSCFVTSIPYQKGMELYVDGEQTEIKIVNTAFVGAYLEEGEHDIVLKFTPPGKKIGLWMSAVALVLLAVLELYTLCKRNSCLS